MSSAELSAKLGEISFAELKRTIGDPSWFAQNREKILSQIPLVWTNSESILLALGFTLKLLGCDWKVEADLLVILTWFGHLDLIEEKADRDSTGKISSVMIRRINQDERDIV